MLDADKAGESVKQHPLAENYPEHYVVVCEGGCKNHQAHIVDFEPRKAKQALEIGEMIPTSAGTATSGANVIVCIGGCPNGEAMHFSAGNISGLDADWDSASGSAGSGNQGESGRWMSQHN